MASPSAQDPCTIESDPTRRVGTCAWKYELLVYLYNADGVGPRIVRAPKKKKN